jgi:hypothetical protein
MKAHVGSLPNLGATTLEVFRNANLPTVGSVYFSRDQSIVDAINRIRQADKTFKEVDDFNDEYWSALTTRVRTVVYRVRSDEARPYDPDHYVCPITHRLLEDPVLSKYGDTYERYAIEKLIARGGKDVHGRPLAVTDLYENRSLRSAIEHHRLHALRLAIPINLSVTNTKK